MCYNIIMMVQKTETLYRSGEAAKMIGIESATLRKYIGEGRIKPSGTMLGGHYVWTLEKINEIRKEMGLPLLEEAIEKTP